MIAWEAVRVMLGITSRSAEKSAFKKWVTEMGERE